VGHECDHQGAILRQHVQVVGGVPQPSHVVGAQILLFDSAGLLLAHVARTVLPEGEEGRAITENCLLDHCVQCDCCGLHVVVSDNNSGLLRWKIDCCFYFGFQLAKNHSSALNPSLSE
jgi:hypothetical protein